jgi:ferredoxin
MVNYMVTLLPGNCIFEVKSGETILDAAIRQQVNFAYSCRNGTCRTCICQVIEGSVNQEEAEYCLISTAELESGRRLVCLATLQSDVILEKASPKKQKADAGIAAKELEKLHTER